MYCEWCRGPFCFSKDYYSVQMFSKRKSSAIKSAIFYPLPANMEEVKSGYMYKSPPQSLIRSLKSWKRRYFVLSKSNTNHYELTFFKDENRREKPLGQINLYQVSLFFRYLESHPTWLWIQKNFRCSASCLLYMKVSGREYFLIGENSGEMDDWFNAIFKALNIHHDTLPEEIKKNRSQSEPTSVLHHDQKRDEDKEQEEIDPKASSLSVRQSAPESLNSQYFYYDYPKNYMKESHYQESEDTDDEEEDEIKLNKESESEENTSYYMDMKSVENALKQTHNEHVMFPQTKLEGNNVLENSLLQTGSKDSGFTALNRQTPLDRETVGPVKKEICISQDELKNSAIFSEEGGKLCVANWRHTQSSGLFHNGDQILAINDLLTDNLVELQTYLKKLINDQVKLTILRQPGSKPLSGCCI